MSASTCAESGGRPVQWVLKSNAKCDQKWLNSGLQVRLQTLGRLLLGGVRVWALAIDLCLLCH